MYEQLRLLELDLDDLLTASDAGQVTARELEARLDWLFVRLMRVLERGLLPKEGEPRRDPTRVTLPLWKRGIAQLAEWRPG